jgi:hypothetical protein
LLAHAKAQANVLLHARCCMAWSCELDRCSQVLDSALQRARTLRPQLRLTNKQLPHAEFLPNFKRKKA